MRLHALLAMLASAAYAAPYLVDRTEHLTQRDLLQALMEHQYVPRATITVQDCAYNSSSGIHPECWSVLDMPTYLANWKKATDCGTKGFAECFLDNHGYVSWSCNMIGLSTCTPPPSGAGASYKSYQEFYAFWNIFSVNQFFSQYHQALLNGQAEAIGAVGKIVASVDPPHTVNPMQPLFSLIWGTSIGVFGALGAFVGQGVPSLIFNAIVGVLFSGGSLSGILFPKADKTVIQWQDISASLSAQVDAYQLNIGRALTEIMTNFDVFMALAKNGAFSQKFEGGLPQQTSDLYHGLMKWTFNQAIQAKGWFAVKNTKIDIRTFTNRQLSCGAFDKYGCCGVFWFDATEGSTYGMTNIGDFAANMAPLLLTAFDSGWTTPQELYLDAQKCRGVDPNLAEFQPGDLSLSCASNTPVCEIAVGYDPDPIATNYIALEFTNCPAAKRWNEPCYDSDRNQSPRVPLPYLGPWANNHLCYG